MAASPLRRSTSNIQLEVLPPSPPPIAGNLRLQSSPSPPLKRKRGQTSPGANYTASQPILSSNTHTPQRPTVSFSIPHISVIPSWRAPSSDTPTNTMEIMDDVPPTPLLHIEDDLRRSPSPVPTEIIEIDPPSQVDYVELAKAHEIKVRDFAYEEHHTYREPVFEISSPPLIPLIKHDTRVRRPHSRDDPKLAIEGKMLWRLLVAGWVPEEEARRYWSKDDWRRMEEYKNARPGGPFPFVMVPRRGRPTRRYRKVLREEWFPPEEGDLRDEDVWMPPDQEGCWDGEGDTVLWPRGVARGVVVTGFEEGSGNREVAKEDQHVDKKQKVRDEEDMDITDDGDSQLWISTPSVTPQPTLNTNAPLSRRFSSVEVPTPTTEESEYDQPTSFSQPPPESHSSSTPRRREPTLPHSQRRGLQRTETFLRL